jgi:hypothetical protein
MLPITASSAPTAASVGTLQGEAIAGMHTLGLTEPISSDPRR